MIHLTYEPQRRCEKCKHLTILPESEEAKTFWIQQDFDRNNGPRHCFYNLNYLTSYKSGKFSRKENWSQGGDTCISSKFGHQMTPLALFLNLVTRWRHLHEFQIWSPDGAT